MKIFARDEPAELEPLLLTKRKSAQRLSIHERTLQDLTQPRGPIPCVRLAGKVLYSIRALEAWIAAKEAESACKLQPASHPLQSATGI